MLRLTCTIFLLLISAAPLLSAPLDRKLLPADVKWFVHLDADAGRASTVGQALLRQFRADPGSGLVLAKFREQFNIDPTQDIYGVTVYGTDFTPESGVLIVRGKIDREKVLGMLRGGQDFSSQMHNAHELYSWTDSGRRRTGAFFDDRTVLVAQSEALVKRALDVLDGSVSLLAGTQSPLAEPAQAGSMLEAGAIGLADAQELTVQSPVLRQCDYGLFAAGEHAGTAFCHAMTMTRAADVAENVKRLIQGTKALAQLNGGDSDVAKLLAPLTVTSDNRTVRVDWQMPANEFADLLVGEVRKAVDAGRGKEPETKP